MNPSNERDNNNNDYIDARKKWIDIMKAFLIIFVVIGHTYCEKVNQFIFWFHMPVFFIISGYLLSAKSFTVKNEKEYFLKKIKRYLIPYFMFYFLNCCIQLKFSIKGIIKLLYGGQNLSGVYWFPICMLVSIIIFIIINTKINNKRIKISIVVILYLLAIIESNIVQRMSISHFLVPFCIDVSFLSITYISIGFFGRNIINKLHERAIRMQIISISALLIVILLIILQISNIINFKLDMKYEKYTNILFVIIIPILFFTILSNISKYVEKIPILNTMFEYIGKCSMTIMYLHLTIKDYFINIFGANYSIVLYCLITLCICCIFNYIINKNKITKRLFVTG